MHCRRNSRTTVMALATGIAWTSWPEYRLLAGGQAVFSAMTGPLRVSTTGRDINVDSLAAKLIIDRSLAHEPTP